MYGQNVLLCFIVVFFLFISQFKSDLIVKGMNEIMGPLYYVFASDADTEWAEAAEADTYYCFQLLMSEIKDNFIKCLDTSSCGIGELSFNELGDYVAVFYLLGLNSLDLD